MMDGWLKERQHQHQNKDQALLKAERERKDGRVVCDRRDRIHRGLLGEGLA